MKEPVDGVARVVMCTPPSIESTSSNYTLDCVVSAPGIEPQAVQHKGMAPVDKWPTIGTDLPIVVDRRHPDRFIIKWDRIEKDGIEAWMKDGKQRAQSLAEQMQSGATPSPPTAGEIRDLTGGRSTPAAMAQLQQMVAGTGAAQLAGGHQPAVMSAADVLANGTPVRVEIIQATALPIKNPEGVDMYVFNLNVLHDGQAPAQAQVGNPVPVDCVHLLYPGANLPAKAIADNPAAVVIDWPAALAEPTVPR